MLLGDFVVEGGVPALKNVVVVGQPYGVYETQPWAPDGSGFLFCAAGGHASPFQATPPGWAHMGVYFMRLYGPGASPQDPQVTLISDEVVAYQEQALFTPDMKTVLMMSNRSGSRGVLVRPRRRGGAADEVRRARHRLDPDHAVPVRLHRPRRIHAPSSTRSTSRPKRSAS